jgi:Arc/MetJ-type ribon-helix-helix transcriptional regulator
MKISVSLSREDITFLDEYARSHGARSRSAAIQRAVRLLRAMELGPSYAEAWNEWQTSGDGETWDSAMTDGINR